MIRGGGRGHCLLCPGPSCSPAGFGALRVELAVRTSSCCLLKGPATDPIHPNSRCHIKSPPRPHARIHTCAPRAHTSCKIITHTHSSVCEGTWNYLQRTKREIRKKMQPLRINLTTMLRKIPNLTPRNARKTWFLSFKAVKSGLQKQK